MARPTAHCKHAGILGLVGCVAWMALTSVLASQPHGGDEHKHRAPPWLNRGPSRSYISLTSAGISPDGRYVAASFRVPVSPKEDLPATLEVRVWEAEALKLNLKTSVALGDIDPVQIDGERVEFEHFVKYADNDRTLVVSDERARLHVLRSDGLKEIRVIDPDLPRGRHYYIPVGLEVSPQGDKLALLLTGMLREPISISGRQLYQLSDFHGAEVRVYSLGSGQLMWTSTFDSVRAGGVAWSPDGLQLAVTLLSGNHVNVPIRWDLDNLLIIDSLSGTKLLGIKTGDLAGPVCFGPRDEVFTAPYHFQAESHGAQDQRVKVWNAKTGQLSREIGYRGRDVHNFLSLSADGRVLLGYVGKEGPGWDLERWVHALDVRFAVWNAETGAPVSLSERLFPHVYADWPGLGLAANGTVAIAYRPWRSEEAVEVFDLPEVPRGRAR